MDINPVYEAARVSRDARFDGTFFLGVVTTGIFCRPICPAKTASAENVRYYKSAEHALHHGFRPCKRCRPELAPSKALPESLQQIIAMLNCTTGNMSDISLQSGISPRHMRRLFQQHLGLSPSVYRQLQRLMTAQKLLTNSNLPITTIAFTAGFQSVRRFNEVFKHHFKCTPSALQKAQPNSDTNIINVTLNYQTPFDWPMMLAFFRHRQIPGIEQVTDTYQRTVALKQCRGWIEVKPIVGKNALQLSLQLNDYTEINQIITRVRRMFDLDANMVEIAKHFAKDPIISPLFQQFNGLRLPGCWDVFEFSIRAILGQQISVKAATTLAGRIAAKYGEKLALESPNLNLVFPKPKALNNADFTEIGVTKTRHQTLTNWVAYFQDNEAEFQSPIDLSSFEKTLCQLKGIGPWTANYIAMRGLSLPDAFPAADLGIIKALTINENKPTIKQIAVMAQAWQPWRAYAAIYLWQSLSTPNNTSD